MASFTTTTTDLLRLMAEKEREKTIETKSKKDNMIQFYGKLVNTCDESANGNCFSAVVAGGRTNFIAEGGDLANIYVPHDDYDTWRQHSSIEKHKVMEGEFVYQLQNNTLSCLTVQLRWTFEHSVGNGNPLPLVGCQAVSLAANWDCHLDWAVTAQCRYNADTQQAEALYNVVNLGPEKIPGSPSVLSVFQSDLTKGKTVSQLQKQTKN